MAAGRCGAVGRSRQEGEANARLIAAAPELLEALRNAVALADRNRANAEAEGATVARDCRDAGPCTTLVLQPSPGGGKVMRRFLVRYARAAAPARCT